MKKTIFSLLLLLLFGSTFSQQTDTLDVSRPTIGRVSCIVDIQDLVNDGFNYWEEEFVGHWAGISVGLNGFANINYSNYSQEQKGFLDINLRKSNSLQINFVQFSKGLQNTRNTVGVLTGAGLNIQSYRLDNSTTIEKSANGMISPKILTFDSNQKSKLSTVNLTVPLLLEFQIPIKHYANRLYVSTGLIASKRLSTHTKIKYRKDGQKQKLKLSDDYYIPEYSFSATVRLGYRWINAYATYDLMPLFSKNMGPEVYPYSFGIYLFSF